MQAPDNYTTPTCPCCHQECDEVMYANINNEWAKAGVALGCNECIEVRHAWEQNDEAV